MNTISNLISKVPFFKRGQTEDRQKKMKVLENIENQASKSDFIHWLLNNNGKVALSEKDDWKTIKTKLIQDNGVSYNELRRYASKLEDGVILEETLKKVEETTKNAEETAKELTDLTILKKFSIMIGGVLLFIGLIRLSTAIGISLGIFEQIINLSNFSEATQGAKIYLIIVGFLEMIGGVFLVAL